MVKDVKNPPSIAPVRLPTAEVVNLPAIAPIDRAAWTSMVAPAYLPTGELDEERRSTPSPPSRSRKRSPG
jgi:hypothetical protein